MNFHYIYLPTPTSLKASFSFDGNSVVYLLHGQEFVLNIKAENCWFIFIKYDSGIGRSWSIHRPRTRFSFIANANQPTIRIWGVGWGVKLLLDKLLNINSLNVIEQKVKIKHSRPIISKTKPLSIRLIRIFKVLPLTKIPQPNFNTPSVLNTKTNQTIIINTE